MANRNPMNNGTVTTKGGVLGSKQLENQKVPQRKSLAAGAREQNKTIAGKANGQFSMTNVQCVNEKPNVTPGLKRK